MTRQLPDPVDKTAKRFLSKATWRFSAWEELSPFRTRNFSPYSPPHSRDTIFATTSSAHEKSIGPIPEKSRMTRSAFFSSPKIFSMASRVRTPRDRPVISLAPFFKRPLVSFFKEITFLFILLLQLIQLKYISKYFIFCQGILLRFLKKSRNL